MDISFFAAAIVAGTPLLLATLGELLTEKAGNLNLGVEGMMLLGAVSGFSVGFYSGNPMLTLLGAALFGAFGALIYAFLTVTLRTNQVVTGLSLTIFGSGISSYMGKNFIGEKMPTNVVNFFQEVKLPILGDIPIIGQIFFQQDIFIYLGYILTITFGIYLYKSRFGLNLRAVGENTSASDTVGINVTLYKYVHILIGGALCGLGGAYLAVVDVPQWTDQITAGRGWIAIALVIFCGWNPYKALLGAFFFGGLNIIGFRIQHLNIPQNLLDMLPYVVTIIVLVISSIRNSREQSPPACLGTPYYREER